MIIDMNHLSKVNSSYWTHLRYGMYFSLLSIVAGLIGIVHTLLPFLFPLLPIQIIRHIQLEFARETHINNGDNDN